MVEGVGELSGPEARRVIRTFVFRLGLDEAEVFKDALDVAVLVGRVAVISRGERAPLALFLVEDLDIAHREWLEGGCCILVDDLTGR